MLKFSLVLVPALFGIICHEVAHGWAAFKMGDVTAKFLGRLSFNPIKHIDPMGLGVFVFTALFSPFVIGWAKPVPIRPQFFRNPRYGMMAVSFAGPMANVLVALLCAIIVKILDSMGISGEFTGAMPLEFISLSAQYGVTINIALALFNLLPVPPLDGSHIVEGLLPRSLAIAYASLGRYGMLILILFIASGFFANILSPLIFSTQNFIYALVGL